MAATVAPNVRPLTSALRRVLLTGADGYLGSRVRDEFALDPDVVVVDDVDSRVDVIVHLGSGDHDALATRRESVTDGVVDSLATAIDREATHLVLLSSAMVYGAWPNNPVPLSEDAILRPDVEFVYARQLAAAEAMVDRWRRQRPGRVATVLRPVVAMAEQGSSQLARSLAAGLGERFGEEDPSAQFLHLDDLAAAIVLAVNDQLDGVYNVAPDGWVGGERVRALTGSTPRIPLPSRLAEVVAAVRWRFQRGPIPPGLRSYTRAPWVVSNDRLKAAGWKPTVTNEQAYVEGTEASWWTTVTPKRRQELALGAMVAGITAAVATVAAFGLRWYRRRSR